jgi:hypothetical protein
MSQNVKGFFERLGELSVSNSGRHDIAYVAVVVMNETIHIGRHVKSPCCSDFFKILAHYVHDFNGVRAIQIEKLLNTCFPYRSTVMEHDSNDEKEDHIRRCKLFQAAANDLFVKQYELQIDYMFVLFEIPKELEQHYGEGFPAQRNGITFLESVSENLDEDSALPCFKELAGIIEERYK